MFAADHLGKQHSHVAHLRRDWDSFSLTNRREKIAFFSDALEETDDLRGWKAVTSWCGRYVDETRHAGHEVLVPYCGDRAIASIATDALRPLAKVKTLQIPFVVGLAAHLPSFAGTLAWLQRYAVTQVEIGTPGPMGLVGFVAAKLLRLPTSATHHTEVAQLLNKLNAAGIAHRTLRGYLSWLYGGVDRLLVFSDAARVQLLDLGIDADRIKPTPEANLAVPRRA